MAWQRSCSLEHCGMHRRGHWIELDHTGGERNARFGQENEPDAEGFSGPRKLGCSEKDLNHEYREQHADDLQVRRDAGDNVLTTYTPEGSPTTPTITGLDSPGGIALH